MRVSFSLSPNSRMVPALGRRMLKPYLILRWNFSWMNKVISGVQAEAWGPLEMAVSKASGYHGGPVWAGMPFSTNFCRRSTPGCFAPSVRPQDTREA